MNQTTRISRDEMLMQVAEIMAQRGTCKRLSVGAVLARKGRIVSSGYVGAPAGLEHCNSKICQVDKPCTRTIHAEANAIAWAAREGRATEGTTLYTTHSPCIDCAKLIINAGIERVVFLEKYRDPEPLLLLKQVGIEVGWSGVDAKPES